MAPSLTLIPDLCPSPSGISVSSLSDSLFVLHVQREDNKQKVPFGDKEAGWGGFCTSGQSLTPTLVGPPGRCGATE